MSRLSGEGQTSGEQQTVVEPLPEVVPRYGRHTKRLKATLKRFAIALSGQAGSHLLEQIGMPASGDTLLRLAKEGSISTIQAPQILGVDDFAFKRGRTYGTILVDLQTHRPIDLLRERTADALSLWLRAHPGVLIISRDRSSEYAHGASDGAPQARQVADRFHLLLNLREATERALKRVHAELIEQQKASGHLQAPRYQRRRSQTEIATSKVARLRRQACGREGECALPQSSLRPPHHGRDVLEWRAEASDEYLVLGAFGHDFSPAASQDRP